MQVNIRAGKVDRRSLQLFLFIVVFRILLDWNYSAIIAVKYQYAGFYSDPNIASIMASWFLLLIISMGITGIYKDSEKLSAKVLLLLFFFSVVPFTTFVAHRCCTTTFAVLNVLYFACLYGSYGVLKKRTPSRRKKIKKHFAKDTVIICITLLFALVVLYVSGRYTHFRFHFSLDDVYDLRAEATTYNMPTILVYLFSWSRALIPVCLAVFIRKKNAVMVAVCILSQLLSFGIDGSKSPLFLSLCVIAINLCPQRLIESINKYIVIALCAVVLISVMQYVISENYSLCALLIRRNFFVPVKLETCYVDFFSDKTPDFFRASFLRYLGFQSPYPDLDNIIGAIYFNAPAMNCNNGLLSDAISNLGYAGAVLMPCLISYVLTFLDRCAEHLDPRVYLSVSLSIAVLLLNTFLMTVLLTHGVLVLMVFLANIERDEGAE